LRNYIQTFWVGVTYKQDGPPIEHDNETFCDGDVDGLISQRDAHLAFLLTEPGSNWRIDSYFDPIGAGSPDGFQPQRWYLTLNKNHIMQILQASSSLVAATFPFWDFQGTEDKLFWQDSPKKDWSNGE